MQVLPSSSFPLVHRIAFFLQPLNVKSEGGDGKRGVIVASAAATDPSVNGFTVDVHIKQFQKRLAVGTIVYVEFIAKARMWISQFYNRTKWSGDQSLSGVQAPLPDCLRYE
ncbi:uncharacterized protein ARMOST_13749 [Armillaria ostoyae]|uniref:Uncharacterized protein n=1 Tax=Armillaria ostoyae TaxID=47428 RepID=A0A284RNK6_ARMOS|nr:uncharacterized protein ARMOST_13749 [Armillaria ostoyae]